MIRSQPTIALTTKKPSDHHNKHIPHPHPHLNIATLTSQKLPFRNHASVPTTSSAPIFKAPDPTPCIITPYGPEQVKLFFERFPSWVEYQDLKRAFCKLGRVTKLFISTRKTVLGRRFGFVDILSPVPISDLCDQANTIWFDTYKLRVNPAKLHPIRPPPTSPKPSPKPVKTQNTKSTLRDNRSFIEVLTNTKPHPISTKRRMMQYVSTDEDKEWLYRSLVGNILPNVDVATMEAKILQTVDNTVSFRFLGASQGIITFVDRLSVQQEQAKEGSLLQSLFTNLRQWEGSTRAHDRFAWLAIFGLPMEGWNKNCIDILLQSWGNIIGYDTTCVSQGSISGIRVLINTRKLEPLHDQVILELDGTQVDVSLQEIKGDLIPSLTTVKHSMDVSLYTESVLSDVETGEVEVEIIPAVSIPRATRPNVEFEFLCAWDNQNQVDNASLTSAISSEYLHPEISEVCRHAAPSDDCMYDYSNRLALVPYEYVGVATTQCIETDVQQTGCFFKKYGLDQQTGCISEDLTMMGQDEIQKPSNMGQISSVIPSSGPSFANFISSIADPIELCDLNLQNRRSQRNKARKLSRKSSSFKRRKSRKMENRSSKQAEMGITEYSVSDNGIMNRNAIIRSGRDLAREDDASSVQVLFSSSTNKQTPETVHPDPRDEANSCWVVGKAILQSHEDSHLMTQTLQGFIEKEQEEWIRRKK